MQVTWCGAGARVVAKAYPEEKVGVFARRGAHVEVVEYSEMDPQEAASVDPGTPPSPHLPLGLAIYACCGSRTAPQRTLCSAYVYQSSCSRGSSMLALASARGKCCLLRMVWGGLRMMLPAITSPLCIGMYRS